jgi:hypothetical protein
MQDKVKLNDGRWQFSREQVRTVFYGQPFQERGQPCQRWKSTFSGWMNRVFASQISDLRSQFSMKQQNGWKLNF